MVLKIKNKQFFSDLTSRRQLLKNGGMLASGAALGGVLSLSVDGVRRKYARIANSRNHRRVLEIFLTGEENFPGLGSMASAFQKNVEALSANQLVIKFSDKNKLPVAQMKEKLMAGDGDGAYTLPDFWQDEIPANLLFSAQPFGLNFLEMHRFLHTGKGYKLWGDLHKKIDMVPLAVGASMGQMGGWFLDEILALRDIRGLSIAARGLPALLYKQAGAKTYSYHEDEVFQALQSGKIEGVVFGDPIYGESAGLYKVATRYFSPAFQAPLQLYQLSLRSSVWEGLSITDKEVLSAAAHNTLYQEATKNYTENHC